MELKTEIWNERYVELHKLLPLSYTHDQGTVQLVETKDGSLIRMGPSRAPRIRNISTWIRAFQIFMSVYTQRYKDATDQMFTYMRDVQELERAGGDWLMFDAEFRKERQSTLCPWNSFHQRLYARASAQ